MTDLGIVELLGSIAAALLTLMALSYLIGDNVLFRIAVYLFIGTASGYAGAIAFHNVLWPGLIDPFLTNGLVGILEPASILGLLVPWLLVIILLLRISPSTSRFGGLPLALLVGVGAAVVVGGAITGTIIPQSMASMESLNPGLESPLTGETGLERMVNVLIMLVGTISTLSYFRFSVQRTPIGETGRSEFMKWVAYVGRLFIALTFGVMYAGALASTIVVLSERIQFLREFILSFFTG